jgi:hypothetical protein
VDQCIVTRSVGPARRSSASMGHKKCHGDMDSRPQNGSALGKARTDPKPDTHDDSEGETRSIGLARRPESAMERWV